MNQEIKDKLNYLLLELAMDAGDSRLRSGEYTSDRISDIRNWVNEQ